MAIDTSGMISVAEAARRLRRSEEQLRRNLGNGKLKGQRVGNQWFVDVSSLRHTTGQLITSGQLTAIRTLRQKLAPRLGNIDVVDMLRQHREEGDSP